LRGEVLTVGHSTRSLRQFLELLAKHGVEAVADVRRFPKSRKFPHFNRESLEKTLPQFGIEYHWLGELLGGYRRGGYEAYTKTPEYMRGIEELEALASRKRTAIMCAEGYWRRCHRRFIAETLEERGWRVIHI